MTTYLILAALLFAFELAYFRIADRCNIIDKPNLRSSHRSVVLRGGGILFPVAVALWAVTEAVRGGDACYWFLAGLLAISAVSFADDVRSVPNKARFAVHVLSMLLMFRQWDILHPESWGVLLLALVFCTGVINAFNFMDGINGINAGYSLAVLAPLAWLNARMNFVSQSLIIVFGIGLLVFCFFNFRTRAKCFAGDVGSVSAAFVLLFITGSLILQTQQLWWLMLMAVYGVDTALTIVHRLLLRESLGQAHRKHLYQLMANELRIPHVAVSAFYMGLQLAISAGLLWLDTDKWLYSGLVLALLAAAYVCFMKKYYHLHAEWLASKR